MNNHIIKESLKYIVLFFITLTGALFQSCDADYSNCTEFNALPHRNDLVSVGDSYIALSSGNCENITVYLAELMGQHYNDYSVSGHKIDDIIGQYNGISQNFHYLLLDGGGNDILQNCTDAELPLCERTINYVIDQAVQWIPSVYDEGVLEIIWIGYPNLNCGGNYEQYNGAVDFGMDLMLPALQNLGIHTIDIREAFHDGGSRTNCDYIASDGLHPSAMGSYLIAELIYDKFVELGIVVPGEGDDNQNNDTPDETGGCWLRSL